MDVGRLRDYLNEDPSTLYDNEGIVYEEGGTGEDQDTDQLSALLEGAAINDDDDMDIDGEGSQFGGDTEGPG